MNGFGEELNVLHHYGLRLRNLLRIFLFTLSLELENAILYFKAIFGFVDV